MSETETADRREADLVRGDEAEREARNDADVLERLEVCVQAARLAGA